MNAKGAGIGNAKGSAIGSASVPRGLSLTSFLGYLITRLRAIVQLDCRVACNHAMGQYPKVVFRLLDCVQSCSAFGFWGLVEMALIMKKLCLCNKMKGGQDFYVTKIVTVWLATDTKQLLNGCQVVESKIGVINHCLINLICMLFLRL